MKVIVARPLSEHLLATPRGGPDDLFDPAPPKLCDIDGVAPSSERDYTVPAETSRAVTLLSGPLCMAV